MTKEEKNQIADKLRSYLAQQGISGNEFAKRNKNLLSSGYVSMIVNEKWDDKTPATATWHKLANFFGLRNNNWPTVSSTNYNRIHNLCEDARENFRMLAIAGYTGAGKTTALRKYARQYADVFYVECRPDWKRKTFLAKICEVMGVENLGTISDKIDAISAKLESMYINGQKPTLLVDNAHKLDHSVLLMLETIYCETENEPDNRFAGIVISGTDVLKKEIDKNAVKDKGAFREFRRRIGYWQGMNRPSKKAVATICEYKGLTDTDCINYIWNQAKDFGTIRELITNAMRMQATQDLEITPQLLASLMVGEQDYKAA